MKGRALTAKQSAFVQAYLSNGMNGAAAYRTAYKSKGTAETCASRADDLLKNSHIAAIVQNAKARTSAAIAATVDRLVMTKEGLVEHYIAMSTYDVADAYKVVDGKPVLKMPHELPPTLRAALQGVQTMADGTWRYIWTEKRGAADSLAKLRGWMIDRHNHRFVGSAEDLSDEELEAFHTALAAKRRGA